MGEGAISFEEALFDMSYINILMYSSSIPVFDEDKKGNSTTTKVGGFSEFINLMKGK